MLKFNLKPDQVRRQVLLQVAKLKRLKQNFRAYDLARVALNKFSAAGHYQVQQNIAYGFKARQRLDLYLSNNVSQHHGQRQAKGLVIFVYGGAWQHGSRQDYIFVAEALTRHGYDVAIIDYQLAPQHKFPSYVDDLALAIRYLQDKQQQYAIAAERLALLGHSAGAFNCMSLLYHPRYQDADFQAHIAAVIGIAGPYHFDYVGDRLAEDAFDQQVSYQQVMPYYFVRPHQARHYLLLAPYDRVVAAQNSYDMQQQLLAQQNHCQLQQIAHTGHVTIMGSMASIFSRFFNTQQRVIAALDESFALFNDQASDKKSA
ncbi:alpha/beta hydrolase [Acinetobacter larvae]|uniref:Alpha/beta hydrolase n=1 Tax=Acinetobacter larvae TaxID=1789224 RepID=A0A1B2M122_9GAMM|nr:alpha/beta hydrolase [Acinetobacter larvae]AOA58890.1 alpha/beta hydrolase [Acinetobacter larvae]